MATTRRRTRAPLLAELTEETVRTLAIMAVLFHAAAASALGFNETDLKCLDLLRAAAAPLTATDLVAVTGLSGGSITAAIDHLEAGGLVERVRDPEDRRRWELWLTEAARQQSLDLLGPSRAAIDGLCAGYSVSQVELVAEFLTGLGNVLESETERLRGR